MPIHVSDYTWHQTEAKILLSLDLHRTSPKNVDIVTTNSYLKVSFLPYIFEAFLCHMINADESTARILNGRIEFDLSKETNALWSNLCLKLDEDEMQRKRQEAIEALEKQEEEKLKHKKDERIRRERFSVSQQIAEDNRIREDRSKKKEEEKLQFMRSTFDDCSQKNESQITQESHNIRSRLSSTCSEEGSAMVSEMDYDGDGEDSHCYSSTENLFIMQVEKGDSTNRKPQRKCLSNRKSVLSKDGKRAVDKETKKDEKKKSSVLPPVRQSGIIQVKYTKRVFPTPSRESREEEEEEWMASQLNNGSDSLKNCGSSSNNVDYYKEKAVSLFENGDYKGCVNACSEALQLNPKMASLYSNRAAANLALNNLHHAINDCSKALELLAPPTPENSKSRLLCHIRRGTAFAGLGLYSEGLLDYRAAHKLNPEDECVSKDMQRIQAIMMASTDSNEDDSESEGKG